MLEIFHKNSEKQVEKKSNCSTRVSLEQLGAVTWGSSNFTLEENTPEVTKASISKAAFC